MEALATVERLTRLPLDYEQRLKEVVEADAESLASWAALTGEDISDRAQQAKNTQHMRALRKCFNGALERELKQIQAAAKVRHEKARKAAKQRGRNSFPELPHECSWAFEEAFYRRKFGSLTDQPTQR